MRYIKDKNTHENTQNTHSLYQAVGIFKIIQISTIPYTIASTTMPDPDCIFF